MGQKTKEEALRIVRLELRLCELMLMREAGGKGYDLAISEASERVPEYAVRLDSIIKANKNERI